MSPPDVSSAARRTLVSGSALLILSNVAALAFNYLHQMQAAAFLPREAFGHFTAWLAVIGIGSTVGLVAQFTANYVVFSRARFFAWRLATAALSVALITLHLVWKVELGSRTLAIEAVALGALVSMSTGQYQARLSFGVMAFSSLSIFGARAIFPNLFPHPDESVFFLATPIALLVTLIVLSPIAGREDGSTERATSNHEARKMGQKIGAVLLLAFCASVFPGLDVLLVERLASATEAGRFAQVVLFTRVPYLLGAALFSMTLPYHVRSGHEGRGEATMKRVQLAETAAISLAALGAPLAALAVPFAARLLVHIDLAGARAWIFLSTLNFAALLALFRSIQRASTSGSLRRVGTILALGLAGLTATCILCHGDVTTYLVLSLVTYTAAALASHWLATPTSNKVAAP